MSDMNNISRQQDASCSSLPFSKAIPCKIPLLDGDSNIESRPIVADVELDRIDELQRLYQADNASFDALLCTAWGLLLRCYVGQDHISFHFHRKEIRQSGQPLAPSDEHQSIFQIEFNEQEALHTHIKRAKSSNALLERKSHIPDSKDSSAALISGPERPNTTVRVQHAGSLQSLAVKNNLQNSLHDDAAQVNNSPNPKRILCRY